ncbi:MAG: hypothetical protein HC918_12725 [Oscillatoriales cyanobacterium SM2_1_8]|nr:hypothetical protein [Oscillatoriales cyanobacterium SM2_1_8]
MGVPLGTVATVSEGLGGTAIAQPRSAPPAIPPKNKLQNAAANGLPPSLIEAIAALDGAASRQDLTATLVFYAPNFRHGDGLALKDVERGLQELWQRFGNLAYRTEIDSWERDGETYRVRTVPN